MIELTDDQHEALERGDNRVRDPATERTYVLVSEETLRRYAELLTTEPLTADERQTIVRGVWERTQWDDPRMDDYERLTDDWQTI